MIITGDRNAAEIAKELDNIIEKKGRENIPRMVFLGMLAGAYIGFGAIACSTVNGWAGVDPKLPAAMTRILGGSVFALGLILVIVPGSELFTGNVLMVAGLGRNVKARSVLANWLFVYLGNFLGAVALAGAMYGTGLMCDSKAESGLSAVGGWAVANTDMRIAMPFMEAFWRGVLCNILVCLAVILALASRSVIGKILGIFFPIMVFVLCGFEHCIANMYFLSAGLMAKGTFFSAFGTMWHNLLPVTLGNIAGGMVLVLMHPGRWKRLSHAVGGAHEEGGEDHETRVLPAK
ncbi:MAG TPA: formate/nitrite transporter family protein [Planctomycetota bacterium]|nr:formate/nitrite transporter family protein [Planctomycetota bacterium]